MKYGYSIFLGEHIFAEQMDYDDCKSFQIVCPCCREPIFKAVRDSQLTKKIHYLLHYEKSKDYYSECELRVNSMKDSDIENNNKASRNQKISYFLKVLKDCVLKNEYGTETGKIIGMISQMNRSKAIGFIRVKFHDYIGEKTKRLRKNFSII